MYKIFGVLLCFIGAIACSLTATSPMTAQHCGRPVAVSHHQVVNHAPVVVKEFIEAPVIYPILVPAYQFQYSPSCYAQPVSAFQGQFGVQQGQFGVQQGQFGVQQPLQANGQDRIKDLAKALLEEMQKQTAQDDGPPVAFDGNMPVNANSAPIAPTGPTKEQVAPLAMAALQRTCMSCHTGLAAKGDAVIFTQPNMLNPDAPWAAILREVKTGRMPQKQSSFRLNADEYQSILIWLREFERK